MAKKPQQPNSGSWLLVEELLERGDPAFVDELRKIADADKLGAFAARWYVDKRAASRRLLLEYLVRPLNVPRHEALVKRLFKLAEQAADDEVMARFLVAFDRSIRRRRSQHYHWDQSSRQSWQEETLSVPHGTTMPRSKFAGDLTRFQRYRLFSVHTRNYLRRRAWRYFRKLGKQHPDRYLPAVAAALKLYEDADVANGVALLDNWGLVHILFHYCPALVAKPHGWFPAPGHTLAELAPAPIYEPLWKPAGLALLDLLKSARCRPVRQWAIRLIRRDHASLVAALPLTELLVLLGHEDTEVVQLAAEALHNAPGLDTLPLEKWLVLLETPNPSALEIVCELMTAHLQPDRITLEQAVWLARRRPLPIARLGLAWLSKKTGPLSPSECQALLGLVEAEAEPMRADLVRWARGVLSTSPHFQPEWVLEYLDSRHAEVRVEGWTWFRDEPRARDNVALWQRLLESPYDDVRLLLIADLEDRVVRHDRALGEARLDPGLVRFLWASVLLNIHRGGRIKPLVVGQLVGRLQRRAEEAPELLPILSVALRSVRGPEWRAGLAGVVQLVERNPALVEPVRHAFPELQLL